MRPRSPFSLCHLFAIHEETSYPKSNVPVMPFLTSASLMRSENSRESRERKIAEPKSRCACFELKYLLTLSSVCPASFIARRTIFSTFAASPSSIVVLMRSARESMSTSSSEFSSSVTSASTWSRKSLASSLSSLRNPFRTPTSMFFTFLFIVLNI